jgi:hypothetical protein
MKQETLEEAAEKYADFSNDYVPMSFGDKFNETTKRDFIEGAKWQQERKYSEEEMLQALNIGFTSTDETWEECVEFAKEQFKKK